MFKVLGKEGRTVPLICCAVCGSWIEDIGHGAAVFESPRAEGESQAVTMVHKGACHDKAEQQLRAHSKVTGWQELGRYLMDALHNGGLTLDAMNAAKDRDDEFGGPL